MHKVFFCQRALLKYDLASSYQDVKSNSPALESRQGFDYFKQQIAVEETVCGFPGKVLRGHTPSALFVPPHPRRMASDPKATMLYGRQAMW